MRYGVGHRHGSDLAWLWLWHRLAAIDPIRSLAWEPAVGAALKRQKDKKKKDKEECRTVAVQPFDLSFPLMFVPLFVPKSIYLLNIPVVSN